MIDHVDSRPAAPGVLVIGAGVSGLTSALCLARCGFRVTVLADRFAPQVTSVVAGALWEWPPAVCGRVKEPQALSRAKAWSAVSLARFRELAEDPSTGVFLRPSNFYYRQPVAQTPWLARKIQELGSQVALRHSPALIAKNGVNQSLGYRDAICHLAPMIDTDVYLEWLLGQVKGLDCRIEIGRVDGLLKNAVPQLLQAYRAQMIVHCTGLGAEPLTGDPLTPLRGALIRLRNDGRAMPRITQAHCVSHDGNPENSGFIFILPRGNDMLVLGGLAEPGQRELDLDFASHPPIRQMYERCVEFLPALRDGQLDGAEPIRTGLRPYRDGVRLECDAALPIVHNYGHGGSGVTLSWGCALEVVDLVRQRLDEPPAVRTGRTVPPRSRQPLAR